MKVIKSIAIITAILVLTTFLFGKVFSREERPAGLIYAVGGIDVYVNGGPFEPGPTFEETNFLPGDKVIKIIRVVNNNSQTQRVGFRMTNVEGYLLSIPLFIKITDKTTGQVYYGGSGGIPLLLSYVWPTEIRLFNLPPNPPDNEKTLEVEIRFLSQAGNEFQGRKTKFDFSLGFIGRLLPRRPIFPFFR